MPNKIYKYHCKIYLCLIEYIFSPLHQIFMSNKIYTCHCLICLRSYQIFPILVVLKTCISENMVRAIPGIPFKIYTAFTIYIEDITRWREDMNFMFEWQEQYFHSNIKFISSSQRVMFFLLYED